MFPKFEAFIHERQYLQNVTPATILWYRNSFRWLPNESPSDAELKDVVIKMRQKGLRATGANSNIRSINAYLRWLSQTVLLDQLAEPNADACGPDYVRVSSDERLRPSARALIVIAQHVRNRNQRNNHGSKCSPNRNYVRYSSLRTTAPAIAAISIQDS